MRKIAVALLALVVFFALASCSNETQEPVSYTITFVSNGGSNVSVQIVEDGKTATRPADPIKAGYKFLDWYTKPDMTTPYDFSTPVTGNITLYAKWEVSAGPVESFTVTFNSLGGSAVGSITVEAGKSFTMPPEPERDGYDFTGWFTDEKCTVEYKTGTPVTGNITLYAGWKVKESQTSPFYGTWESTENLVIYDSAYNPHEAKLYISFDNDQMVVYYPYGGSTPLISYTYEETSSSSIVLSWKEDGKDGNALAMITDSGIQFTTVPPVSVTQGIMASAVSMEKVSSSFDYEPNLPPEIFESPNDWFTFESRDDGYMVKYFIESSETATDIVIPSTYNGLPVVGIGANAFSNESNIKSVVIPDSVKFIGARAFYGCWNLESVEMSENITSIGNNAFVNCRNLKSIEIPAPVTSIGYNAFEGCSDLETVKFLGNAIGEFDNSIFVDCNSLTEIEIPSSVTVLGSGVFSGCSSLVHMELPENLSEIGMACFYECSSLTEINIPSNITKIENSTFSNCTSLRELFVPATVTRVADDAFDNCIDLTVTFDFAEEEGRITNNGLPYELDCNAEFTHAAIIFNTFGGSEIDNVYVKKGSVASSPAGEPTLDGATFDGWYTDVSCRTPFDFDSPVDESVEVYAGWNISNPAGFILNDGKYRYEISSDGKYVIVDTYVSGSLEEGDTVELPSAVQKLPVEAIGSGFGRSLEDWVTEFTVPGFIKELEDQAFYNSNLSKVVFTENIERLGDYIFSGSSKLTDVVFPEGWKTISDGMFFNCESLVTLTLPETVEYIGGLCFKYSGITTINIPAAIKEVGDRAFESLTITSSENVENLEIIRNAAFGLVKGFSSDINFKSLKSIEDYAFSAVKGIQTMTMPSSLETVGYSVLPSDIDKVIVYWPNGERPEGWSEFWMGSVSEDNLEINAI